MADDIAATIGEMALEAIRVTRGYERILGMKAPVIALQTAVRDLIEVAPELEPEMNAILEEAAQIVEHLEAAGQVLDAKLNLAFAKARES